MEEENVSEGAVADPLLYHVGATEVLWSLVQSMRELPLVCTATVGPAGANQSPFLLSLLKNKEGDPRDPSGIPTGTELVSAELSSFSLLVPEAVQACPGVPVVSQ